MNSRCNTAKLLWVVIYVVCYGRFSPDLVVLNICRQRLIKVKSPLWQRSLANENAVVCRQGAMRWRLVPSCTTHLSHHAPSTCPIMYHLLVPSCTTYLSHHALPICPIMYQPPVPSCTTYLSHHALPICPIMHHPPVPSCTIHLSHHALPTCPIMYCPCVQSCPTHDFHFKPPYHQNYMSIVSCVWINSNSYTRYH